MPNLHHSKNTLTRCMLTGTEDELDSLDTYLKKCKGLASDLKHSCNTMSSRYAYKDPSMTIDGFLESLSGLQLVVSKSYKNPSDYNATLKPFATRTMSDILPKLKQNTANSTLISCYAYIESDLKALANDLKAVITRDPGSDLFEALGEVLESSVDTGVSLKALSAAVKWHKGDGGASKDALIKEFEDNIRQGGTTGTVKEEDSAAI